MATASVGEATFPSPYIAVGLTQNCGCLQDGKIGGHSIENIRRERRAEQGILEKPRPRSQTAIVLLHVRCDLARILPERRIIRMPWRRSVRRHSPAPRRAFNDA